MTRWTDSARPFVSVVIPAYNQAQYLRNAIDSVLGQTYRDFEIIVVDDGSTDGTAAIAKSYGERITYVHQENLGLAGARNTGIRHATSRLIALLDADDEWLPQYLRKMTGLVAQYPQAAVYYCCAQGIDTEGNELPQVFGCHTSPADDLLNTLLRVNFLIPSTVLLNYHVIPPEERFDPHFRRKQDRELWIRLLKQGHSFRELPETLVRYRIHQESLSVDVTGGQQATMNLVEKHFGKDDGHPERWDAHKRRAYGGAYRYHTLTVVQRQNNWQDGARYLKKALSVDPTLAADLDLFYELALGSQPTGYRGTGQHLNLATNAAQIEQLLAEVFSVPENQELARIRSQVYGTAFYALGLLAYNTGELSLSRRFFTTAGRYDPVRWFRSPLGVYWLKTTLGPGRLEKLRQLRRQRPVQR